MSGQKIFITVYNVQNNPEIILGNRYSATIIDKSKFGWHCVYDNHPWSFYLNIDKITDGLFLYNTKTKTYFPLINDESPTIKIELQ